MIIRLVILDGGEGVRKETRRSEKCDFNLNVKSLNFVPYIN